MNNKDSISGEAMKERQKHGYFFSLSVIGTDMQSWASHFNLVWKTQDLLDLVIDGVLERKMVSHFSV